MITAVIFVIVLLTTVIVDALNGPDPAPAYLTGLLGAAAAAFFAAAGSDKSKRDKEVADDASTARRRTVTLNEDVIRTEAKTDRLVKFAKEEHPDRENDLPEPLIPDPKGKG